MFSRRTFVHLTGCITLALGAVVSQAQKTKVCHVEYQDENQVDYGSQHRVGLLGIVTDAQSVPISNVCLGIFTENNHRLVASILSNAKGKFQLPFLLRDGQYRLVAKFDGFGVANMKFTKVPETYADQILHVHMRVRGVDSTSYIDTK